MLLNAYNAQEGPPKIYLTLNVMDAEVRYPCPTVVGMGMGNP